MAQQIQIRRDTSTNWTSVNPTLAQGELGFETNTNKLKIGDGTTAWNSLAYYYTPNSMASLLDVTFTSLVSGQVPVANASGIFLNQSLASLVNELVSFASLGSLAVMNQLSFTSLLNQPSLSSLAFQATIDYTTAQLTNKPALGSLAVMNQLSFTSLTNQPSLSSLAFQATIDYTSAQLTNKPSLGSLAPLNSITQEYLPSTASFDIIISNVFAASSVSVGTLSFGSLSTPSTINHNQLGQLTTGDVHTQYAFLTGRAGGQTLIGGTNTNNVLNLVANTAASNTATNNAIRFSVGNGGNSAAFVMKHNGTVDQTVTTSSNANGYNLSQIITGTSGDSIGANYDLVDTGGGVKTIFAHRAKIRFAGATTLSGMQSTSNQLVVNGGGTVEYAEILTSNLEVTNNSTVNNATLVKLFGPTVNTGGTIGTLMGINLPNINQATNNFSIYSEGGTMYHAGNVGIGTTTPGANLDVNGAIKSITGSFSSTVSTNNLIVTGHVGVGVAAPGSGSARSMTLADVDNNTLAYLGFNEGTSEKWVIGTQSGEFGIYDTAGAVFRMKFEPSGETGIGIVDPTAKLDIDQESTTATIPVLQLDQADLSEEFINFVSTIGTGNPIIASSTATTFSHKVRVAVNGTFKWLYLYNA